MNTRKEYAAFHFLDNIIWLAYYRTGGGREDTAYTEGWTSTLTGTKLHAEIRQILYAQFGLGDSSKPFLVDGNHSNKIVGIGSVFIGCRQVFFDRDMCATIKGIMMSWFEEHGIPCLEVTSPWQSLEEVNTRWKEPMGPLH